MIKSKRKFGVEVEFVVDNMKTLHKIADHIDVVHDGSLRPHIGGEWVSRPLTGKKGEAVVKNVCALLKKNFADVHNPQTSFHVHLDGLKNEGELEESEKRFEGGRQLGISNAVLKSLSRGQLLALVNGTGRVPDGVRLTHADEVAYLSKGLIYRHPRTNYKYFRYKKMDRTKWLRNVFYFYTMYTEVMLAMVSNSRRKGNMYCIPLADSFELKDIENCKSIDDIANVWYKGGGPSGHYDDSRYHNVNLHAYFDRHGTVEIRSHGSTLDPLKILMWVRLHQHIVDRLESVELEDIKTDKDVFLGFLDFISDDPMLVEYYKRLIGYFGGVTIKNGEVIRKT